MFSKACEYSIRAMLHIAHKSQSNERVSINEIAQAIDSPKAYTGKLMQLLSKRGLVKSTKGPSGGFWIEEEKRNQINIRQIVELVDGNHIYERCELGLSNCNDLKPCPLHNESRKLRAALIKMHTEYSLEELATKLKGKATLK